MSYKTFENSDAKLSVEVSHLAQAALWAIGFVGFAMLAVFLVAFSMFNFAILPLIAAPVCFFAALRKGQANWQISFNHDDGMLQVKSVNLTLAYPYAGVKLDQIKRFPAQSETQMRVNMAKTLRSYVFRVQGSDDDVQSFLKRFQAKQEGIEKEKQEHLLQVEKGKFNALRLPEGASAKEGTPVAVPLSFANPPKKKNK